MTDAEAKKPSELLDDKVGRTEFSFESADGKSQVHAVLWIPLGMEVDATDADGAAALGSLRPRGVVQLVHGMSEHIGRYDHFARYLAAQGYLVCGHDHVGHGQTAGSQENLGNIDPESGAGHMIDDAQQLRILMLQQVSPQVPYFMFGHSMGSLVLRSYLPRYGRGLSGAVICGTAQENPLVARAGNAAARAIAKVRGADYKSKLLHSLADGSYGRQIKNARTPHDWLSTDPAVVDDFRAAPDLGFMFSAGGYATLTKLAYLAAAPETLKDTPHYVPLLYVAGEEDPVGRCGKGVREAAEAMEKAGAQDLTLRLFPTMRHEILNEVGKEEVYEFIAEWIEARS